MNVSIKNLFAAVLLSSAALVSTSAQANLITNGSFETGNLTGWTSDAGLNPFGTTYGQGMDGTYWHWVAGYERSVTTSQTVGGLIAGQTYSLTFVMASEFTSSDQIRVSIDGGAGTIFTGVPYTPGGFNGGFWADNWVSRGLTFTAAGTSALIQFDTVGLNIAGYDVGLDNVVLMAAGVPEPATWTLMIGGFGLAGAALRRQSKARAAA